MFFPKGVQLVRRDVASPQLYGNGRAHTCFVQMLKFIGVFLNYCDFRAVKLTGAVPLTGQQEVWKEFRNSGCLGSRKKLAPRVQGSTRDYVLL